SFPSIYQLLPSPLQLAQTQSEVAERLYLPQSYGTEMEMYAHHFARAKECHNELAKSKSASDPSRAIAILGHNQPTVVEIRALEKLRDFRDSGRSERTAATLAPSQWLEEVALFGPDGD